MTDKRAHVPWQIVVATLASIAITGFAILFATSFLEGASSRISASVALALVVFPSVGVIVSVALFIVSSWRNRRQE